MSKTDMELFNDDPMEAVRTAENTLSEIMRAAEHRERENRAKLESLRSEFANLLLDLEMGRSSDTGRKIELRTAIRGLEYELTDFQILQEGFKREGAKIVAIENKARQIIRDRRSYLEIKDKVAVQGPGMSFVKDLHLLAKKLGCSEDAESFLASLAAEGAAQAQEKAV